MLVEIDLDGSGRTDVATGVRFYDHMLTALGRHALFDLTVQAEGDVDIDAHHTVEDVAIVLGQALREALGDKRGIRRFGDALVPLDEALCQAVVDVSGRPYCVHEGEPPGQEYALIGGHYIGSLTRHVIETLGVPRAAVPARTGAGGPRPAPRRRGTVQGHRPCAARRRRDRPARERRTVHEGHPVTRRVVVLDYGSGNVRSAVRALERVGADVTLTADRKAAAEAEGLVVPGVGAFAACVNGLRAVGGDELVDHRLAGGRPVLGICVGMQVLFARGVEHGVTTDGLGEWPGTVEQLAAEPLPHIGWNTVDVPPRTALFAGIEHERFYFVHSYAVRRWELVADEPFVAPVVTWSTHGGDQFVAAVENGPLVATQFHPEKSGDAGAHLLENWLKGLA